MFQSSLEKKKIFCSPHSIIVCRLLWRLFFLLPCNAAKHAVTWLYLSSPLNRKCDKELFPLHFFPPNICFSQLKCFVDHFEGFPTVTETRLEPAFQCRSWDVAGSVPSCGLQVCTLNSLGMQSLQRLDCLKVPLCLNFNFSRRPPSTCLATRATSLLRPALFPSSQSRGGSRQLTLSAGSWEALLQRAVT